MADIKISALPGASTLTGTETIPLVQGGTTKKVTTDQFLIKDGSGNVGLGTASPTARLSVAGTATGSAFAAATFVNEGLTAGSAVRVNFISGEDGSVGRTRALIEAQAPADNSGSLAFYTRSAGSLGERMKIDQLGNIGVATAPAAWNSTYKGIQVGYSAAFHGRVGLAGVGVTDNAYRAADGSWKRINAGYATRYEQDTSHAWFVAGSSIADSAISFTQAMTLDASGNLLVGTGTSSGKLTVGDDANGSATVKISLSTATTERGFLSMNGSIGEMRLSAGFSGYGGFQTFYANGAERARIDASGNLLVGETSASGKLHITNTNNVSGDTAGYFALGSNTNNASSYFLQCVTSGVGAKAYILGNGNLQNANNSYGAFSDVKLKENITDASPKLAKLMQVRIVNYTLKSDPEKTKLIGVVAQELEKVSPGLIEETADFEMVKKTREVEVPAIEAVDAVLDEEGNVVTPAVEAVPATTRTEEYTERVDLGTTTKSVKYSVFVPMLIKGMQEQQAQIESLAARLAALEAK